MLGVLAQLIERSIRIAEVKGLNPLYSTILEKKQKTSIEKSFLCYTPKRREYIQRRKSHGSRTYRKCLCTCRICWRF